MVVLKYPDLYDKVDALIAGAEFNYEKDKEDSLDSLGVWFLAFLGILKDRPL